jgi:hypothetical protein
MGMKVAGRQPRRAWRVWALWLDGAKAGQTQEMLFDDPKEVNGIYTDPGNRRRWKCLWQTEA